MHPGKIRLEIRENRWIGPTAGAAAGYAQANLVVLPEKYAFDFLLFCQRNPKPCPVLEVMTSGRYMTRIIARNGDIRTDIPLYTVYRNGSPDSVVPSVTDMWQADFVSFLLGCSFSFEDALLRGGVPVRHMEEGKNVPMYITNIICEPAGIFEGPMVVSMRPVPSEKVLSAIQITSRYTAVHGAPVHIGDPSRIGIHDLRHPDFGDAVTIKDGEVPLFWACGVTPQAVVMKAKPDLCITHAPGHMFITDALNEELACR